MLEMAINNVEVGSELDRVHIVTFCDNLSDLTLSSQAVFGRPGIRETLIFWKMCKNKQ